MQAGEALTLLIEDCAARTRLARHLHVPGDEPPENIEETERLELAQAVCTAMLNTMLPVSRFRAFVEVKTMAKKQHAVGNVDAEFTACAVSIAGIRSALSGVSINDMEVRIAIFEQQPTGAVMISGFEGFTKSQKYRVWYGDLGVFEKTPTVN